METAKKKKDEPTLRTSFWRQHYPLVIVILILGSLLVYISITRNNVPTEQNDSIIYPLLISPKPFISFSLVFIPVILFLIVLFALSIRQPSYKHNVVSLWSDLFAWGIAMFLGCGICIYFLATFLFGESYIHQDRLNLNDHSYMLTKRFVPDDSGLNYNRYVIFECDTRGIICFEILETLRVNDTTYAPELAFNEATQELSILINGEAVHIYPLE